MQSDSMNIVSKFDKDEIPEIYESLIQGKRDPKKIITHSIVDLSENKIYHLEFPKNYNSNIHYEIIKSSEIWDNSNGNNNIPIGNNAYIKWIDIDWKNESVVYIDDIVAPMKQLFDGLEINCDRMCCGVEAFSFAANQIQEISSKLKLDLTPEINQIITKVESIDTNVVGLTILNQNFEKKVFIKLLNHIKSNI